MSAGIDNLPDIDMHRPLRVTFGKKLRYAPTLTELIPCRRHRDGTLQPVPLPKVGPNTPYPSFLKGTHRRVHQHYQCKDLNSTALWAAAYRDIYERAVQRPVARHQLGDAKLSFDDGKFFHLSHNGQACACSSNARYLDCGHVIRVRVLRPLGSTLNHGVDQARLRLFASLTLRQALHLKLRCVSSC